MIEQPKMRIINQTGRLRMFAETSQMPLRLQEEWIYRDDGEREWRDIPIVIGNREAPTPRQTSPSPSS
jgi:hypothetical protein